MTQSNEFTNQGQNPPPHNPPPRDRQLVPGQMLEDKYEVMSLIGVGGMGKVYKVRQVFLNKALALKVLDLQQMGELQIRRFQLEAKAAFSLSHPNLVKVFDFGLLEKVEPYLVMDFVDGITLHEHLKKNGPLTPEQAVKVFVQAASGLAYAHRHMVVHRDIKPSNIMLDAVSKIGANNTVKIVDFGIAKLAESGEVQGLTRTGEIFGSPLYMSPEQCSGEIVDHRSDIYSLGCSLFESLTGTPPHVGNSALRTMMLHQTAAAPYLREASLGVTYPENLEQIVHRMLAKSPNDRYQSLDDVVEDLSKALGQASIVSKSFLSSADAVAEKTESSAIPIKPVNLALIVLSTMALSSAATLGVEHLLLRRFMKPVPVAQTVVAPVVTREDARAQLKREVAEESKVLGAKDSTDDEHKFDRDTKREFEKAKPIVPKFFEEDGRKFESLNFPKIAVGELTNWSFWRQYDDRTSFWTCIAQNNAKFPVSDNVHLRIGGNSGFCYQGLQMPWVLKKLDPTVITELHIEPARIYTVLAFEKEKQNEMAGKVLEIASNWKNLDGISIQEMKLSNAALRALDACKSVEFLQLWGCEFDSDVLARQPLLMRLKYLSLSDMDSKKIIDGLSNSSTLESLSLSNAKVTAKTLEKLKRIPGLTFLDLRVEDLSQEELENIAKLKNLEKLLIRESKLTPAKLHYLLDHCRSLKFMELSGTAAEYVHQGLVEDPRIKCIPDPPTPATSQ